MNSFFSLLSKFINQFFSKFRKLSLLKKIVLIIVLLFPILLWRVKNYLYHYILNIIGIPQISSITGLSTESINWILFTLISYIKIIFGVAFGLFILLAIWKKKKRAKLKSNP